MFTLPPPGSVKRASARPIFSKLSRRQKKQFDSRNCVKKPLGLIRYSSQQTLETGVRSALLRPRIAIYGLVLAGLLSVLTISVSHPAAADVTILRGLGAPFLQNGDEVINQLRLKVHNRSDERRAYRVEILGAPEAKVVAPELPLALPAGEQGAVSFFVVMPRAGLRGQKRVQVRVTDGHESHLVPYTLLGPEGAMTP